jgi:hypothetical protein
MQEKFEQRLLRGPLGLHDAVGCLASERSRDDLTKNADGSVDLYLGPEAPKGFEKNWIPTLAGKAWFPYFRLYGRTEAHFDRTCILPN